MLDLLRDIRVDGLFPSPTNPRKHFDEGKLTELAESIKSLGIQQPVVVRQRPTQSTTPHGEFDYEIVAGERRWRAAKIAGLKWVPCIIRDLTDQQVLEVQVIENNQREDVHPLEECDGFRAILASGIYGEGLEAVEQLASKLGKSVQFVYSRLKLADLVQDGRNALLDGKIGIGQAELIARLVPEDQIELLGNCARGYRWSVRDVANWIEDHVTAQVSKFQFPVGEANLLPQVGSCLTCPKNTRNASHLFPEIESEDADDSGLCTDRSCRKAKEEAYVALRVQEIRNATGREPTLVTTRYHGEPGVLAVSEYKEVQADAPGARPALIVSGWNTDHLFCQIWIVDREGSSEKSSDPAKRKDQIRNLKIEKAYRNLALGKVLEQVAIELPIELLREVAKSLVQVPAAVLQSVCKAAGIEEGQHYRPSLSKAIESTQSRQQLNQIIVGLLIGREIDVNDYNVTSPPKRLELAASTLGVSLVPLKKQAKAEFAKPTAEKSTGGSRRKTAPKEGK